MTLLKVKRKKKEKETKRGSSIGGSHGVAGVDRYFR
jgi:hypothetical protein